MNKIKGLSHDKMLDLKYSYKSYKYVSPKVIDHVSINIEILSVGNDVWNVINRNDNG